MPATAKIFGDTTHLRRALRSGSRDFEMFGQSAARSMEKADKAGTRLLSTFSAIGVAGARNFMEVARTVNYTIGLVEDLDKRSGEYAAGLRDISRSRGVNLGEAAWAGYGGISAGQGVGGTGTLRYVDLIAAMQSGFANISGQSAAEYVGKISQAARMPVGLVSDYTAYTEAKGTTDFSRLVSAVPKFASLGDDLGVGLDQQMAMMAVASTYQPTSDEAGTGIARMFEEALTPTAVFYKKFRTAFGRTVKEAIADGEGDFLELLLRYRAMVGEDQFRASFGSKRGGLVASQLTRSRRALDLVGEYEGAYGLTMRAADRMSEDTPGLWDRARAGGGALLHEIGEGTEDATKQILSAVIDVLNDPDLREAMVSATQMLAELKVAGVEAAAAILRLAAKDVMPGGAEVSLLEMLLAASLGIKGVKYGGIAARGVLAGGRVLAGAGAGIGGAAAAAGLPVAGGIALGAAGLGALGYSYWRAAEAQRAPHGVGRNDVPLDEHGLPTDWRKAYADLLEDTSAQTSTIHPVWSTKEYVQHYQGTVLPLKEAQAGVRPPQLLRPEVHRDMYLTRDAARQAAEDTRMAIAQRAHDRSAMGADIGLLMPPGDPDAPQPTWETRRQAADIDARLAAELAAAQTELAEVSARISDAEAADRARRNSENLRAIKQYDAEIMRLMGKAQQDLEDIADTARAVPRTATQATIVYRPRDPDSRDR